MTNIRSKKGFTLIELIVVISILAILAGALIPRITNHMAEARDARRLADIKAIQSAISQYFIDKQAYPPMVANPAYGGYDVSLDGGFIPALVQSGYLPEPPVDPAGPNGTTYYYGYQTYTKGTNGCFGDGQFYVLGIKAFETSDYATKNPGYFKCSGKNWNKDFAFVTGGGASETK